MTMNKAYSQSWFLYNELSQITPMPTAWDRTASGPSHCTTTVSDCAKVYAYLDCQAKALNSYVTSPLWCDRGRAVEAERVQRRRPHHLRAEQVLLRAGQAVAGRRSRRCRSPPTPPSTACCSRRAAPARSTSATSRRRTCRPSRRTRRWVPTRWPARATRCHPLSSWGINYYVMNFQSTDRQRPDHQAAVLPPGAGVPDEPGRGDPGPAARATAASPSGRSPTLAGDARSCRRRASRATRSRTTRAKAKSLLTSHGWKVVPGGVTTCTDPSLCGPGVKAGPAR